MPRDRQRRRWKEGNGPRGTRPSVTRSGLGAGKARSARTLLPVPQPISNPLSPCLSPNRWAARHLIPCGSRNNCSKNGVNSRQPLISSPYKIELEPNASLRSLLASSLLVDRVERAKMFLNLHGCFSTSQRRTGCSAPGSVGPSPISPSLLPRKTSSQESQMESDVYPPETAQRPLLLLPQI
jgi:hypothetical protein